MEERSVSGPMCLRGFAVAALLALLAVLALLFFWSQ